MIIDGKTYNLHRYGMHPTTIALTEKAETAYDDLMFAYLYEDADNEGRYIMWTAEEGFGEWMTGDEVNLMLETIYERSENDERESE